ncbi:unnamed protein product [Paramecium primaurelia]|uniref:Uncharacterized protein n=1 Tax=Paramecium primaurelia TaxID=5886 RepID=A0A8S1NAR8_PARPR|nr:unnamed protein product [Paramecium primaurelia]
MIQFTIIEATYTFVANNDGNFDDWVIYNSNSHLITNCGDQAILGGIDSFNEYTIISRMFNDLNPHYQIRLDFWIWIIDSNSITDIEIELDQQDYIESISSQLLQEVNYCGQDDNESIKKISFILTHTKQIGILFAKFKYNDQQRIQWGMQRMELNLDLCSLGCSYCTGHKESDCQNWQNLSFDFPINFFLNPITFLSSQIYEFSQYYECQRCDSTIIIEIVQTNSNTHILSNQQYIINEDIILQLYDDGSLKIILIEKYGIAEFNFRLFSRQEQYIQQTQIQYQIKYHEHENMYPFMPGCIYYLNKECIQCNDGWEFNKIDSLCQPICGNNKIEGYEACDDGNNKPYDGCFECKYQCIQDCMNCQNGICVQCTYGFKLDEYGKKCQPICGDGILVPHTSEYCDDGNQNRQDGCFNCMYECNLFCSICIQFECYQCEVGFYLKNGVCNPKCGDQIILPDFEECDDGNDKNDDGCHECKLVCDKGCEVCEQGKCQINCEQTYGIGFYYINEQCQSICGDSIITVTEEYDDGNNIQFDGCFNCQYSCEQNCLDCQQGSCLRYQNNCGKVKVQDQEQCDNGNEDQNEGCFNCFLEPGWKCEQIQKNDFCNLNTSPVFIYNYLSIWKNQQLVLFQFSQKIKVINGINLTESMILEVNNISKNQYQLTIIDKLEPLQDRVQDVYYLIQIEINSQIDFKPYLNIDLNATILNNDNDRIEESQYQLKLEVPQFLNQKEKQFSKKTKEINSYLIYIQIAIGIISLVLGQPTAFFEILDILQFFSYFKYICVSFPQNLEIFFEIGNLITISQIYVVINFEEIYEKIIPQYDITPQFGKFLIFGLNADLLSNTIPQMIQFLLIILCTISSNFIYRFIYFIVLNHQFVVCMTYLFSKINSKYIVAIKKLIYQGSRIFNRMRKHLNKKNVTNLMIINGWDLIFKSLLYLKSFDNYSLRNLISIILACFILAFYGFITLNQISNVQFQKKKKNMILEQQYESFNLIKQIIFLLALILIQTSDIIQIALMLAISLTSILVILTKRKNNQFQDFISIILQEGSILIFILSSLAYAKDFSSTLSYNIKLIIGWIHIFLFSFILILKIIRNAKNIIFMLQKIMASKKQQSFELKF